MTKEPNRYEYTWSLPRGGKRFTGSAYGASWTDALKHIQQDHPKRSNIRRPGSQSELAISKAKSVPIPTKRAYIDSKMAEYKEASKSAEEMGFRFDTKRQRVTLAKEWEETFGKALPKAEAGNPSAAIPKKLATCKVIKTHDDGDLTLKCKDAKYIVTTEGETFRQVKR